MPSTDPQAPLPDDAAVPPATAETPAEGTPAPAAEEVRVPIVVQKDGQAVRLQARQAVILGAGGFERNQAMREAHLPQPTDQAWTATPPEANTGDAIRAGAAVGAQLHLMAHTWGVPTMMVPKEEKFRPMFVERSWTGPSGGKYCATHITK